jgi:hypothetical protein
VPTRLPGSDFAFREGNCMNVILLTFRWACLPEAGNRWQEENKTALNNVLCKEVPDEIFRYIRPSLAELQS